MTRTVHYDGAGEVTSVIHHGANESYETFQPWYPEAPKPVTRRAPPPPARVAPPPPTTAALPPLELLRAGQRIPVAWGHSTVLPDMDFEGFSAAGFEWDEVSQKFKAPLGATKKGLPSIGAAKYAEDPSTEVLCLAYDLKNGTGRQMWLPGTQACRVVHNKQEPYDVYIGRPGPWGNPFEIGKDGDRDEVIGKYRNWVAAQPELMAQVRHLRGKTLGCWCSPKPCHGDVLSEMAALPWDLIDHLALFDPSAPPSYEQRGLIETHNSMFEFRIWTKVLHERWGCPAIDLRQMRCSMAKARAFSLPGALGNLAEVLRLPIKKDKDGAKQLERFSWPRNPTKANPRTRITCAEDPENAAKLYSYCDQDIVAEAGASLRMPDLIPQELEYWLADQQCNWRGVGVDLESVHACIAVLQQAHEKYNAELYKITGGTVARASEISKLQEWVSDCTGYRMKSGDTDAVEEAIEWFCKKINDSGNDGRVIADYEPVIRALEIRNLIGSAAVKKVYAMARMATKDARLCDLFIYHGARTGRDTHADVQPGNLPKSGPNIRWCGDVGCGKPYAHSNDACPWCGASSAFSDERSPLREKGWTWEAVEDALHIMRFRNLELVEYFFGDAVLTISGCVRSLLAAAEGHDLLCSDYSAIEAVVLAVLAGETWRIEAFRRGESIYYHGAASVTGKPYQFYVDYKNEHGQEHPDRNKIGKVAELALGFMGWVNAWRNFDKSDNFTDEEVKALIVKWRDASPMLAECAGGQTRGKPWRPERFENYGYEGMFLNAVLYPNQVFTYRGISFQMIGDALYVTLLSGRRLTYHSPRAERTERFKGVETYALSYMTWNSNPSMGVMGWSRMETYAGRLIENIVQATARDLMSAAVVRLEKAGYPVVMRVHDEIVSEVPEGFGSKEEFEALMSQLPDWAAGWPVRCGGTYRAKRYKK